MELDKAMKSRMVAVEEKYDQPIAYWTEIIQSWLPAKHMAMVKKLKEEHGMTHGHANMLVFVALDSSSFGKKEEDLAPEIFKGKEMWKPMMEKFFEAIQSWDMGIEIVPKKKYYSLRTKKQLGILAPATKTRFEVHVNLKGEEPNDVLLAAKPNGMCSHLIHITDTEASIEGALTYIKRAAERAM